MAWVRGWTNECIELIDNRRFPNLLQCPCTKQWLQFDVDNDNVTVIFHIQLRFQAVRVYWSKFGMCLLVGWMIEQFGKCMVEWIWIKATILVNNFSNTFACCSFEISRTLTLEWIVTINTSSSVLTGGIIAWFYNSSKIHDILAVQINCKPLFVRRFVWQSAFWSD